MLKMGKGKFLNQAQETRVHMKLIIKMACTFPYPTI
jgi:hypothetical protein